MQIKGTLVNAHVDIFVQLLEDDFGFGLVEQKTVKIDVKLVVCRNDFGNSIRLCNDVAPRTCFHFEGSVTSL